ncbi:MAG: S9 family peptidase [Saprospiraceae bacterium]|nr:S9 family peptidase [Saprospiraceae bacterium]
MSDQSLPGDLSLPSSAEELQTLIELGQAGNHKYSVEDFFRNPEKSAYQLSPGGEYFSYTAPFERRKNVCVQKIGEEQALQLTKETDRDISGYGWASASRILYIKDAAGDENFQLYAIDLDGGNPKELTPFEGVRIQIIDILEDNEDEIIIGMNKNNPQLFEPYRLNIHSGALNRLAENRNVMEPIDSWMTDHAGRLRIATKVKGGTNTVLMYRDSEEEDFREIIETDFTENMSPLFFDFEHYHIVYASSNLGRDKSEIVKFDMHAGKEVGDVIFGHPDVDVSGLHYSKKRKVLTSISYTTDKVKRKFLDEQTEATYHFLTNKLPGFEVGFASNSKDEHKFIIRTYSDRSLGAYYFFDAVSRELVKITDVSPWLHERDLVPMKPIAYQSRDGLTIHGYLSLPSDQDKNLPIIINPHGGPWVRDAWGYNPEVQLFANRGYGVLQMNYRSSTGYGKSFFKAGFKEWGKKMQDDITDGVHWLIDEGIADPVRISIYGGSYGGYATLAGVTFTPELYCCAIDYVGVSNLFTFMKTIPPYWKPYLDMMYAMVGNPEHDAERMREASPAYHIDKISAPLFVIQGANDPRVNIDESDQIVRSLRESGIDVPYMVKYDEGHGFHNEENRFEVYKAALGFLAKHLG